MIKTVRFQEHVFAGKAQVGSLHKVVLIAGVFQDIAQTDIVGEEAGDRRRGVAFKRRKQRNTALGGDHASDCVIGTRKLHGIAEIQTFVFQRTEFRGQIRERVVVKIGALEAFAIDINQIQLRVGNRF